MSSTGGTRAAAWSSEPLFFLATVVGAVTAVVRLFPATVAVVFADLIVDWAEAVLIKMAVVRVALSEIVVVPAGRAVEVRKAMEVVVIVTVGMVLVDFLLEGASPFVWFRT